MVLACVARASFLGLKDPELVLAAVAFFGEASSGERTIWDPTRCPKPLPMFWGREAGASSGARTL